MQKLVMNVLGKLGLSIVTGVGLKIGTFAGTKLLEHLGLVKPENDKDKEEEDDE